MFAHVITSGWQLLCKFLCKSVHWDLLPKYVKYSTFVTFLTPVLSFFSRARPQVIVGLTITLSGLNDVFPRKEVPFGN